MNAGVSWFSRDVSKVRGQNHSESLGKDLSQSRKGAKEDAERTDFGRGQTMHQIS